MFSLKRRTKAPWPAFEMKHVDSHVILVFLTSRNILIFITLRKTIQLWRYLEMTKKWLGLKEFQMWELTSKLYQLCIAKAMALTTFINEMWKSFFNFYCACSLFGLRQSEELSRQYLFPLKSQNLRIFIKFSHFCLFRCGNR